MVVGGGAFEGGELIADSEVSERGGEVVETRAFLGKREAGKQGEVGESEREVVDGFAEGLAKGEVSEHGREVVNALIETFAESEMGEKRGEAVHRFVEESF